MSQDPILLIGGSGIVGRHAARYLRAAAPGVPLLIGGRNLAKARKVAEEVGYAGGIALDLAASDPPLSRVTTSFARGWPLS